MFKTTLIIVLIINLTIIKIVESDIEMEPEFIKWLFQKDVSLKEIKEYKCLQVDQENGLNIDMDCIHLWYPDYTDFKRRLKEDGTSEEGGVKGLSPSDLEQLDGERLDIGDEDDEDNEDEDDEQPIDQ